MGEGMARDTPAGEAALRDRVWVFAGCRLDGRTLELFVSGQLARLEPKPLELLLHLLRHAGEVVTKDELQDAVWPGRILSESVLNKAVAKLRQALADEDQAIVKTVHGYGYRLVAPVRVESATALAPALGFKPGDAVPHRPNWRLQEALGHGGFGEAWLAEHAKTHERRVFKFALDAGGLTALKREITLYRVLRETYGDRREWVRLLDWNIEEAPFFIEAEYVAGGDLRQWAEARGGLAAVPLSMRIALAAQAADALSLAHAAGLLHKDLKPANLLVDAGTDGEPQVKLSDFGSGRLLDPARVPITRLGFTGTAADDDSDGGTPLYVAPECLAGQQPTVRSDIYSLGILLFQLLLGDLRRPLTPGWEADIDDELLREDVHAAAAGDPARRLGDAAELAQRLRGLAERRAQRQRERIAAAEADRLRAALERSRARRRWAWSFAAVFALAAAVSAGALVQLRAANRATEAERAVATAVNEFLVTDLIGAADPMATGESGITVREVLDRGARSAGERFAGQARSEAAVRLALGRAYLGVGDYAAALSQLEAAATIPAAGDGLRSQARLEAIVAQSNLDDWGAVLAGARALLEDPDPGVRLHARQMEARALLQQGDSAAAVAGFEALAPAFVAHFGPGSVRTARMFDQYALTLRDHGDLEGAIARSGDAIAAAVAAQGEDHLLTLQVRHTLGGTLYLAGRNDEAVETMAPAVERAERVLGPDHYNTLIMVSDLASVRQARGELAEAEALFLRALDGLQRQFGPDHKDARTMLNNLGLLAEDLGRPAESVDYLRRAWEAEVRVAGERSPNAMTATNNYARALGLAGRWAEAEALQARNVAVATEVLPGDHWQLAVLRYNWANQLGHLGRREQAEALFEQSIAALTAAMGAGHPVTQRAISLRDGLPPAP